MPRYIDADALIQKRNHAKAYSPEMYVIGQGYVMDAPTVDAVPVVRGEWGQCSAFDEDANVYTCSVCGEPWTLLDGTPQENNMHYCPNCGAKMEDKP